MKENWKAFDYTSKEGITIKVEWWPKDFVAVFESEGIRLSTGLHIMYAIPKVYTEEMLRSNYCEGTCKLLKNAFDLLQSHPTFVEDYKNELNSFMSTRLSGFTALHEERRKKRRQFKNGEISQREWTCFCQDFVKVSGDCHCEKSDFTRAFVSRVAGENISLQNILMAYLETKCSKHLI